MLRSKLPEEVTIAVNIQLKNTPLIFGEHTRVLWGKPDIEERLGDLSYRLSPRAFVDRCPLSLSKTVVYVSCNPVTLAKDCKVLIDGGFAREWIQPVDMFPQTTHAATGNPIPRVNSFDVRHLLLYCRIKLTAEDITGIT